MIGATMRFYVHRNVDGSVHVQNAVAGMLGQHHVHSPEGFEKWSGERDELVEQDGDCGCGLRVGQVRERNGDVWDNPRFS